MLNKCNWYRVKQPDVRWELRDCLTRLGLSFGFREWARRHVSYWRHRALYRYWHRLDSKDPNVTLHGRTYFWQLPVNTVNAPQGFREAISRWTH